MTRPQITLPADVYDTLELTALAFGGIGAGAWDRDGTPCCIVGHARGAGIMPGVMDDAAEYIHPEMSEYVSDDIVNVINLRKGRDLSCKVTWEQYCREGNIVRGDA